MSMVLVLFKLKVLLAIPTAHKLSQKISVSFCGYPRSVNVWRMLIAACPTINAAAYSVAVAEVTTVLMITLMKQIGALGASLSAQSPKNKMPPARDRASDSLR